MKVNAPSTLPFVFLLLFTGQLVADEYQSIFDGKSLAGWHASNMSYWSVRDGAITAESTEANPCTSNQFLVWQGGDVADFELKVKFRLAENRGNSGIQFRSRIDPDGMGIGYQADILPGGPWCGALADEYTGRKPLMVPNGHKTVVDIDGKRTCTPVGKPVSLRKPGEWNEYHILARGHHMILKVNGRVSAEFIDNDAKEFDPSGILGLQLRSGPPMKVQFKDIRLKRLRTEQNNEAEAPELRVGRAATDITPDKPERGKKIKVFLLAGQSNMEGRADGSKLTSQDRERLRKTQDRVQLAFNYEPIRALDVVKPSAEIAEIYERNLIFGPELFFGVALSEAWPEEKVLLIKRTEGGTSLHGCWNPDWQADKAAAMGEESEPKLYGALTTYVKQVLSGYREDEYELCAMLWVQGETDAGNETAAAEYGSNLRTLVERIRHDVGREALPFLLFQVGHGKVVEGMKRTAREVSNVTLIPQSLDPASLDFYQKMENGHYNYEGVRKLGHRFAELFLGRHFQEHE